MGRLSAQGSLANCDSAAAMLRATAGYLRGEDFPHLGMFPRPLYPVMRLTASGLNVTPQSVRERIYIWSGWSEGIPARQLGSVSAERIARWMVFNTEPSAAPLEEYLDQGEAFDDIYLMLFSHGVDSIGLAPIERWQAVLQRVRRHGQFLGVDPQAYPHDFGVFINYQQALRTQIPARYAMPGPLALSQLESFLDRRGDRYQVQWADAD